ncbi:MAG: hypothetical protein A2X23_11795 [Chloroflexi bacterium GWC2_73_18]|nr:MAG: hypothetical protein A2X23_11795 [Chloroflexi bacterium GWC2_73_18]
MSRRARSLAPVLLGFVAGLVLVVLVIGALVANAPDPATRTPPPAPTPSPPPAASPSSPPPESPSAPVVPSASVLPSGSLEPSPGTSPSPPESGSPAASGSPTTGLQVGDLAPPLVVDRLGGGTIDLAAHRGHPVWVNFLASTCLACRDELPLIASFVARHPELDLVVIGVDIQESPETAAAFAEEMGLTFPVGVDPDGKTRAFWAAWVMPVHFWIDRDGIVRAWAFGGIGPPQMGDGLGKVLPGVVFDT